jgi:hypothetical protein
MNFFQDWAMSAIGTQRTGPQRQAGEVAVDDRDTQQAGSCRRRPPIIP